MKAVTARMHDWEQFIICTALDYMAAGIAHNSNRAEESEVATARELFQGGLRRWSESYADFLLLHAANPCDCESCKGLD